MGMFDYLKPIGTGNKMFPGLDNMASEFFFGTDDEYNQMPTMTKGQQRGLKDVGRKQKQLGEGGYQNAIGLLQQYLDPNSDVYKNFEKPYMQQFEQETLPGIAERFAGGNAMGSGLMTSGFGQSLGAAGANLQAQLAQMKQQYQRQSINDLLGQYNQLTNTHLGNRSFENTYQPGQPGVLNSFAQGVGQAVPGILSGFFGNNNQSQPLTGGSVGSQGNFNRYGGY